MPHHVKYAEQMSALSSNPQVRDALGLSEKMTSLNGTLNFITFITEEEEKKRQYSRVMLDENKDPIGVITLKDVDWNKRTCHMGTWIGYPFWGRGYNALAKKEILAIAFFKLDLKIVFAGAKKTNTRSLKAQEKLPYISLDKGKEFPNELEQIEASSKKTLVFDSVKFPLKKFKLPQEKNSAFPKKSSFFVSLR